jgi:hypothetical protein
MPRTLGSKNVSPLAFWIFFAIFVLPLVIKFNWSNARDSAVYANALSMLISGENPYEGRTFRAGLFGSSLFFLISRLTPDFMEAAVFIILGISGLVLFISTISSIKYRMYDLFALVVIVWSSTNRESLNTIQITGLLLALTSISIFSINKFYVDQNKAFLFVGSIAAAIAIDLKPHLVLPSLILVLIARRCYKFLGVTSLIWLLAHLVIDLLSGRSWTLVWLKLLLGLASSSPGTTRSDLIGFWSIVSTIFGDNHLLNIFPYVIILIVLALSLRMRFIGNEKIMILGFSLSLFTTYTHYYDYVPIIAICVMTLLNRASDFLHYCFLGIIMLSQNVESAEGLFLALGVLVAFLTLNFDLEDYVSLFIEGRKLLCGVVAFLILHWLIDYFTEKGFNESSISAFCVLMLCWVVFIRNQNVSIKSLNQPKLN